MKVLLQNPLLPLLLLLLLYGYDLYHHCHLYIHYVGMDKSLAWPTSQCCKTESIVSLERGVHSCADLQVSLSLSLSLSLFLTEGERKHVRGRMRFQQHWDASCHQVFFLQGKALKEIHTILTETLGAHAPLYAIVKNRVAQFKRGDFSTCDAPCPDDPKQWPPQRLLISFMI